MLQEQRPAVLTDTFSWETAASRDFTWHETLFLFCYISNSVNASRGGAIIFTAIVLKRLDTTVGKLKDMGAKGRQEVWCWQTDTAGSHGCFADCVFQQSWRLRHHLWSFHSEVTADVLRTLYVTTKGQIWISILHYNTLMITHSPCSRGEPV